MSYLATTASCPINRKNKPEFISTALHSKQQTTIINIPKKSYRVNITLLIYLNNKKETI